MNEGAGVNTCYDGFLRAVHGCGEVFNFSCDIAVNAAQLLHEVERKRFKFVEKFCFDSQPGN